MSNFQLNIPITKVDEEQRIVYGYATQEILDRQGDVVDYEASKKAFSAWPGNIREQHDSKRAVGKNVHLEFDDDEKRILIGAKLSQSTDGENALIKVKEGILTGFSIGGKIYKTIRDTAKNLKGEEVTANRIMDYELAEVSLVDVPACPTAEFVMVKSVDGELQEVEEMHEDLSASSMWFNKAFAYSPSQVNRTTESLDNTSMSKQSKESEMSKDELEKVNVVGGEERDANAEVVEQKDETETVEKVNVHGGEERDREGNPVEQPTVEAVEEEVVEEPKKDKKTKADEPEVTKSLYSVASLADCLDCLRWIASDVEWESKVEGDDSGVAAQLKSAVAQVAQALAALATEEAAEIAEGTDVEDVEVVELADQPTDLKKMVSDELEATTPDLVKSVVEAVSAKVTEQLKPLEERLKTIENQPVGQAPVRQFTVVDKVADSQPTKLDDLLKRAEEMANDETASPADRANLALELRKAQRGA